MMDLTMALFAKFHVNRSWKELTPLFQGKNFCFYPGRRRLSVRKEGARQQPAEQGKDRSGAFKI